MALVLQGVFLGLGSIVRLDRDGVSGLFVVLARGAYRPDTEQAVVVSRYLVAPHPYGEAPDQETFPILSGEVQEVVFEGYTDDADSEFLDDVLDQMENGRRPTTPAAQFTEALTAIPEMAVASPQQGEGVRVGDDPFAELRRLADVTVRKGER